MFPIFNIWHFYILFTDFPGIGGSTESTFISSEVKASDNADVELTTTKFQSRE